MSFVSNPCRFHFAVVGRVSATEERKGVRFLFWVECRRRRCYGVVYEQYLQIMVVSFGIWLMEIRAFGGKIALTCHPNGGGPDTLPQHEDLQVPRRRIAHLRYTFCVRVVGAGACRPMSLRLPPSGIARCALLLGVKGFPQCL